MGDEGLHEHEQLSRCVLPHKLPRWEKSYTSRLANAATRLVLSSGKSSLTSMASIPLVPTMVTLTSSWRESTSTTMKPLVASMCPVLSLWILSPVPWTQSALDLLDRSSDQTTLSSDRAVLETTGPRVTTQRELSS